MLWKVIAGIGVATSMLLGLAQLDGRYAKSEVLEKEVERIEIQTVQTFEKLQRGIDIKQYDMMQESVERDYKNCKEIEKACPENAVIKEQCEELKIERDRLREKKLDLIGG